MRHAEAWRLARLILAGCPEQEEEGDDYRACWCIRIFPPWLNDGVPDYHLRFFSPTPLHPRCSELRALLERWRRNEGEWPLAGEKMP